jgi:hypothetical protein
MAMKAVTDKVKEKWLSLYQSQLRQLAVFVKSIEESLQTPEGVDKIVPLSGNYQEVIDVAFLANKFGLESHASFSRLTAFSEELRKSISTADARGDHDAIKRKQSALQVTSGILFVVGFGLLDVGCGKVGEDVPYPGMAAIGGILSLTALILGASAAYLTSGAQTEMKKKCADLKAYLSTASLNVNDFAINCDPRTGAWNGS